MTRNDTTNEAPPIGERAGDTNLPFFARHGLPIGIQLFALMPNLQEDLAGTLRQVGEIGYEIVETAGLYGHSARDFRAVLDGAGLSCRGMHVQPESTLMQVANLRENLDAIAADAHDLGASQVVMSIFLIPSRVPVDLANGIPSFLRTAGRQLGADDYRRTADFLNDRGASLAAHGLRLSYHNHNFEFAPLGDTTGLELMLAGTDPTLVDFELDVGWAAVSGADTAALLTRHAGRFTQIHIKDVDHATKRNFVMEQSPVEVGLGAIDWRTILPAAHASGVRGYFIEQEPPFATDRIGMMRRNHDYMARLDA